MASERAGNGPGPRDDARALGLAEELGAQLTRLKGAGPKIAQFLSMLQLDPPSDADSPAALGALRDGRTVRFDQVRKVIEQDLGGRVGEFFADVDEEPFALASLGQVHRGRTADGDHVAIKVQHAGTAEAVESGLRNVGVAGPILQRLAPGLDAGAVLGEIRERISEELDYEIEAQHQRRLERRFRGHPQVRIARVHTDLSTRRVLVTDFVDGLRADEMARLDEQQRDRVGEIVFRFFLGLAWQDGEVAGDPHPDNCVLCPDGRVAVLDFGLRRDLDMGYVEGERAVMRALADGDATRAHAGLSSLGYVADPAAIDPDALLEHLTTAGEWLLAPGFRRVDAGYVGRTRELGYPPRSPYFGLMRRLVIPPETLLLRRMEIQLLALLGALNAGADWGAMAAEHHSGAPVTTALGTEARAFHERRARR